MLAVTVAAHATATRQEFSLLSKPFFLCLLSLDTLLLLLGLVASEPAELDDLLIHVRDA